MEELRCKHCYSTDLYEEGGYWVCSYCGSRFKKETADSRIALDNDVAGLLEKCRRDPRNAKRYANLVLDIDPTNREALRYLK